VIGLIDLGGTKLAAAVATDGRLGPVVRKPTPGTGPAAALVEALELAGAGDTLDLIAAAVPGPFDRAARVLADPPGMPAAWRRVDLREALSDRFRCDVILENDANCAALAEALGGAGKDLRTVVYVTVSTGVGTGVVRDKRLVISRQDTEGGHQVLWPEWLGGPRCHCGGAGCLEALASGWAIEERYGVRGEALEDGDAWSEIGRWLGLGVANTTALLDPEIVVFGGGVCRSWDRFAPALLATLRSHVRLQEVPPVRLGALDERERTLLGALALASAEVAA